MGLIYLFTYVITLKLYKWDWELAASRSCPSNTEDKNVRIFTSIAPYAFLIYRRTKCTFIFLCGGIRIRIRHLCLGHFVL